MSSKIQIELTKRIWKDKLDFFFSQPVDQYYDSMEIFETTETSKKVAINSTTKSSKFMKFFKGDTLSEDERTSASGGEHSSGDCDFEFREKSLNNAPVKNRLTSYLKNGWDVSIKKQKGAIVRQMLSFIRAEPSSRGHSRGHGISKINYVKGKDVFKKSYY
jgi:hypothetical protein